MPRVLDEPKTCVDPHGIVHSVVGYNGKHTECGWWRIWREQTPGGVWVNLRWKLAKGQMVTCLGCIAGPVSGRIIQTPYKYT